MAEYGKKASDKVESALHKEKLGQLKSGSGEKVTSRKQAIAIGLSEARKAGGKVPTKPARKTPTMTMRRPARSWRVESMKLRRRRMTSHRLSPPGGRK